MNVKEAKEMLERRGWRVYEDGKPEDYDYGRYRRRGSNDIAIANAIAELKRQVKNGAILYRVWNDKYYFGIYTGRELVKLARTMSRNYSADVKHFDHSKGRAKQRDLIVKERFDDIPLNTGNVYKEDIWNWD